MTVRTIINYSIQLDSLMPKFSEFDNSQSKPNGTHDKLKNNNHVATSQMAEGQHRTMKEIKSVADTNSRMLESILGLCHTIQAQNSKIEKKIGQLELDVEEMKSGNPKLPEAPRTSPRSCERADMLALVHNQLEATNNKVDTIIQNVNGVNSSSPKLVKAATNNTNSRMLESILGLCHTIQAQNSKIEKKIGQLELDVEEMKSGNPKLPKAPRTSPRSCERADMLALVHNQLEATNNKVKNVNGVNSSSPKLVKAATNSASNCKCTEVESSQALVHSQLDSTNTKVDNFINKKNDNKFELNLRCTNGLGLLGLFAGLFAGVVVIKLCCNNGHYHKCMHHLF